MVFETQNKMYVHIYIYIYWICEISGVNGTNEIYCGWWYTFIGFNMMYHNGMNSTKKSNLEVDIYINQQDARNSCD